MAFFRHRQNQWVDSRDRPIPNPMRTTKSATAVPVGPTKNTLSTPSLNPLLSNSLPQSATATQPESSGGSEFEPFSLCKGIDEFKGILLEYGRSIIRSAMSQDQDQSEDPQDPETEILNAKERVIAYYVNTAQSLSEDLDLVKEVLSEQRGKIGRLEEVAALEEEKSSRIQDLELEGELLRAEAKEGESHLAEMKRYQGLWEEDQQTKERLEVEVAGLRQDNTRKRAKMDEVWSKMEMAVEQ